MLAWLERSWRVAATGACFIAFGVGSVVLGAVVFPWVRLLMPVGPRRHALARAVIHHLFRSFVALMRLTRVISVEVNGRERLRADGQLILANHPTLIDVVVLMSLIKRSDCIVKGSLGRNPVTRGPVRAAGFVLNDSADAMVSDCVASVRHGNNLIIFPEGTRTSPTAPLRLQRGAARVAIQGGLDITPVRIHCSPPTLRKGDKWYRVPLRRPHLRIDIDLPIAVAGFIDGAPHHALAARRLTEHLTDYFSRDPAHANA